MKKTLLLLIVCLMAINTNAQNNPSSLDLHYETAWTFFTLHDNQTEEFGMCSIVCNDKGVWWLEHLINCKSKYLDKKYYIPKGKHLFLKFDDGEVFTLECIKTGKKIKDWTAIYSYFVLDDNIINKLKSHQLNKMRCEIKDKVIDVMIVINEIKTAIETIEKRTNEELRQRKLKDNPLDGF